jgi:hypothetical protein
VPTAASWAEARRAPADLLPLLRFRAATLRGRARWGAAVALVLIGGLSVAAAWIPALLPGAAGSRGGTAVESSEVLLLLPSAYLGVLAVAIISAVASAGGRELVAREEAVAFPVSPGTDHLGALLLAPLNIAWLLQAWSVLGATAYAIGPRGLLAAQVPVLLWLAVATALAQAVAWAAEWVRRHRHGAWVLRALTLALAAVAGVLVATDRLVPLLDRAPTVHVALAALYGSGGAWVGWWRVVVFLVGLGVAAVLTGAALAYAVALRPARDELRVESSVRAARPNPAGDLVALLRTDRAGIWRSVPLRRGLALLAVLPGLVALAGGLDWSTLCILPGLVASGGALLFGVNAWCLDGRGALWRESLPVPPVLALYSRALVLLEVLLVATCLTLVLAALRAGLPTPAELVAVGCAAVVVTVQVVATSLRWSVRRPFGVDLRNARATPAPPLVMVGYSARLALSTTLTGMLFTVPARYGAAGWAVLLAVPFVLLSAYRLARVARAWGDPVVRARVAVTVAS